MSSPLHDCHSPIGLGKQANGELNAAEKELDNILTVELDKHIDGDSDTADVGVLTVAVHRLEHLLNHREASSQQGTRPFHERGTDSAAPTACQKPRWAPAADRRVRDERAS